MQQFPPTWRRLDRYLCSANRMSEDVDRRRSAANRNSPICGFPDRGIGAEYGNQQVDRRIRKNNAQKFRELAISSSSAPQKAADRIAEEK